MQRTHLLALATSLALSLAVPHRLHSQQSSSMPGMDMHGAEAAHGVMPQHQPAPTPQAGSVAQPLASSSPATDALSFSYNSTRVQELENLGGHAGTEDLPAPELLLGLTASTPMTLDAFLLLAQRSHPALAQARSYVDQTTQQARQVALPPNPTIGYSGEHIRGGEYGGGEQGAYVSQQFVLGGKLGLRRDLYRAQNASNSIGIDEQLARVRDDVGQQFYRTLIAQASVVLRQRLLKVALDGVETAHQLANLGQSDAPDVLTAELEGERAKVDFVHAQREFLAAFGRLAAEAGARDLPVTPVAGNIEQPPALDAEAQVNKIVAESPTVKRAQAEVRVAEARLKNARREPVPDLTVKAGEWRSGDRLNDVNKAAGPMSFVDAGITLPLWNRNQGNISAAKVQLERAQNEVARVELSLKRDAVPLAQHYLAARFEVEHYRTELLPRARRAYQLYVLKYQQMAQPYLPALASQRMLFELQMNYLHALEGEWTDAIALENYTLMQGLEAPLNSPTGSNSTTLNLPNGGSQ